MIHTLKTWPKYLDLIGTGEKTFEVRRNDRNFQIGDILHLVEFEIGKHIESPRQIIAKVSYIMPGGRFGLDKDFCVMAIKLPENHVWPPRDLGPALPGL